MADTERQSSDGDMTDIHKQSPMVAMTDGLVSVQEEIQGERSEHDAVDESAARKNTPAAGARNLTIVPTRTAQQREELSRKPTRLQPGEYRGGPVLWNARGTA